MVDPGRSKTEDVRSQLTRDGFVVFRQILGHDEIVSLRAEVDRTLDAQGIDRGGGKVLPNAAAEAPGLSWIFCHPAIISAVKKATGLDDLVFTMEADFHRNYLNSNWHKDSGEQVMEGGYFGCNAIESTDCRVYKVAIYLQDITTNRASLHVRPGSQKTSRLDVGAEHSVTVRAGDIVLFDVRTTHRGVAANGIDWFILGLAKMLFPHDAAPKATRMRRRLLRAARREDRLAVYFAYGIPNAMSEQYTRRNMKRQIDHLGRTPSSLPVELVDSFSNMRIGTIEL